MSHARNETEAQKTSVEQNLCSYVPPSQWVMSFCLNKKSSRRRFAAFARFKFFFKKCLTPLVNPILNPRSTFPAPPSTFHLPPKKWHCCHFFNAKMLKMRKKLKKRIIFLQIYVVIKKKVRYLQLQKNESIIYSLVY